MSLQKKLNDFKLKIKNQSELNCPYCNCKITCEFKELKNDNSIATETRNTITPCCWKEIQQVREIKKSTETKNIFGKIDIKENKTDWSTTYPKIQTICTDEKIPDEFRKDINDANAILKINKKASVALTRNVLDMLFKKMLKMKNQYPELKKAGNLKNQIVNAKNFIHPKIFRLLTPVRNEGNSNLHDEFPTTTIKEATFLIQAVHQLAEQIFINDPKDERMIEQINSKEQSYNKQ